MVSTHSITVYTVNGGEVWRCTLIVGMIIAVTTTGFVYEAGKSNEKITLYHAMFILSPSRIGFWELLHRIKLNTKMKRILRNKSPSEEAE
jgi:hypothetical protein